MLSEQNLSWIRDGVQRESNFPWVAVRDLLDHITAQDQIISDLLQDSAAFQRGVEAERQALLVWLQWAEAEANHWEGRNADRYWQARRTVNAFKISLGSKPTDPLPPVAARLEIDRLRGVLRRIQEVFRGQFLLNANERQVLNLCREGLGEEADDAPG